MIKKYIFILFIVIIIIIFLFIFFLTQRDGFSLTYEKNPPTFHLKDYENIPIQNNKIYGNPEELKTELEQLYGNGDDKIIINIINGDSGFGSQITIFMQHMHYFNSFNSKIICLPHFSNNSLNFKYHVKTLNNSFFVYFKRNNDIINLNEYKIYFLQGGLINNYPFVEFVDGTRSIKTHEPTKNFIELFRKNFKLIKNNDVVNFMDGLKSNNLPLIGIHMRSAFQKMMHDQKYLSISVKDRLINLKKKMDEEMDFSYSVFMATDVESYIDFSKTIFNNVSFIDNITRIKDEEKDIIANLDSSQINEYELGTDLLDECLALSCCETLYTTGSNISYIVLIINPDINIIEF
jgi:hypothetical protein